MFTPAGELVQPDLVRLERVPGEVEPLRPLLARPDTVLPPVAGDEVATRVSDGRHPKLAYEIHDVGPESVRVRRRVLWLVDPVVDASAEMLDKGAEQATIQRTDDLAGIDDDLHFILGSHALDLPTSPQPRTRRGPTSTAPPPHGWPSSI